MKRRGAFVALILLPLVAVALWLGWLAVSGDLGYRPLSAASTPTDAGDHAPWFGAVHVHSDLSDDASGSLDEIVAAATAAKLDFVVISEHTRALGSRGRHESGWHGEVLVVVAEEISTTAGHLLALGVPPHPYALGPTSSQALRDIAELGGWAVLAHPDGGESSWTGSWTGVAGAEVVSLYSSLQRASEAGLLRAALAYPINPAAATARLLRAPSVAISDWDRRIRLDDNDLPRRIAAVGSVDAHGPGWLGLPSYRAAFEGVQMMVWPGEAPAPDPTRTRVVTGRVVEALAEGRSAVVQAALGVRPRFGFEAQGGASGVVPSGGVALTEEGPWTLRAQLPAPGPWEARLLRDGVPVVSSREAELEFTVDRPGTYRVEVVRELDPAPPPGSPPWILSNPIYVWPSRAVVAARFQPVPPLPPPPVSRPLLLEPGWSAEGDASHSAMAVAEQGLRWEVRMVPDEHDGGFAALSWRPESTRDWRSRAGLAIHLGSTDRWRISLRVWTRGPAGGELTWERVVPAGPDTRPLAVVWDQFRAIGEGASEGAVLEEHLDAVSGVALVVTPQRMRPGASASILVRELGLFGR